MFMEPEIFCVSEKQEVGSGGLVFHVIMVPGEGGGLGWVAARWTCFGLRLLGWVSAFTAPMPQLFTHTA